MSFSPILCANFTVLWFPDDSIWWMLDNCLTNCLQNCPQNCPQTFPRNCPTNCPQNCPQTCPQTCPQKCQHYFLKIVHKIVPKIFPEVVRLQAFRRRQKSTENTAGPRKIAILDKLKRIFLSTAKQKLRATHSCT